MGKSGIYNKIPNCGKVVPYKPIDRLSKEDWAKIVEIWGKPMTLVEFCFTSQKILDEKII